MIVRLGEKSLSRCASIASISLLFTTLPAVVCNGQSSSNGFESSPAVEHSILEFEESDSEEASPPSASVPKLYGSHAVGTHAVQSSTGNSAPSERLKRERPSSSPQSAYYNNQKRTERSSVSAASRVNVIEPSQQPVSNGTASINAPLSRSSQAETRQSGRRQQPAQDRATADRNVGGFSTSSSSPVSVSAVRDDQRQSTASPLRSLRSDVIVDPAVKPTAYTSPVQDPRGGRGNFGQSNDRRSGQSPQREQRGQANNRTNERTAGKSASEKKSKSVALEVIKKFNLENNPPEGDAISLRLADVLTQGQSRASRSMLVNQYWETFFDWAQASSAEHHRDWVNGVRVSKQTDQATVAVAKSSSENEVSHNQIQLGKSQAKLKEMLGSISAIVPADLPTVTMVKTNYAAFKQRGLVPARFDGIDETLKELHGLVAARAQTVEMAQETAEQVKQYYESNRTTIDHLLSAGQAWRDAEAEFISSTIEYNKAYADYALALPYGQAPVEKVVSMLVIPQAVKEVPIAQARPDLRTPTRTQPDRGQSNQGRSNGQQFSQSQPQPRQESRPNQPQQQERSQPRPRQDAPVRAASNGFNRQQRPTAAAAGFSSQRGAASSSPLPQSNSGQGSEGTSETSKGFASSPASALGQRPSGAKKDPFGGSRPSVKPSSAFGSGGFKAASPAATNGTPRPTPDFGGGKAGGFSPASAAPDRSTPKPPSTGYNFGS